jgi:hypothetical protein
VNRILVAVACGRKLRVFDSFAGLPDPNSGDSGQWLMFDGEVQTHAGGDYAGSLQES